LREKALRRIAVRSTCESSKYVNPNLTIGVLFVTGSGATARTIANRGSQNLNSEQAPVKKVNLTSAEDGFNDANEIGL